jgi:23S rRNA (guanosine2251-2'-O)-methyltransferase
MKPPSNNRSGRGSGSDRPPAKPSGKAPFRAGGPRPATPRAPQGKTEYGKTDYGKAERGPRQDRSAEPQAPRTPERPVLTIARPRPDDTRAQPPLREDRGPARRRDSRPMAEKAAPRSEFDSPKGTLWLYGTHAVSAALANPARRLRRLLLTEEAEAAVALSFPKPWPITHERTDRARLDLLLGRDCVHQGVALLADPLTIPSLAQALERQGPVLVLDQVSDPRNVGAILRSAAVFGAACVITQERNAPDESGALAKAASGALERIPLLRAVNIARTLVALKAAGCWVVGLDAAGKPLSGPALAQRRVVLVLGSEGEGMRRLTRETCDELAGIPMKDGAGSAIDSLNVSAACTVALYELARPA